MGKHKNTEEQENSFSVQVLLPCTRGMYRDLRAGRRRRQEVMSAAVMLLHELTDDERAAAYGRLELRQREWDAGHPVSLRQYEQEILATVVLEPGEKTLRRQSLRVQISASPLLRPQERAYLLAVLDDLRNGPR